MNGELAHRAYFAHFFQVAKARSDSDHRQRGMQSIPSLGVLNRYCMKRMSLPSEKRSYYNIRERNELQLQVLQITKGEGEE